VSRDAGISCISLLPVSATKMFPFASTAKPDALTT